MTPPMPAILSACLLLACLPVLAASEDDRPVEDAARFKLSWPVRTPRRMPPVAAHRAMLTLVDSGGMISG